MSPYLLAPVLAWFAAQFLKYLVFLARTKRARDLSFLYQSGNMPSVHTAAVTAVTVAIGIGEGVSSPVFAFALTISIIIAYDAMQVRRAAGEQGLAIKELLEKAGLTIKPYHALGHKPVEVLAGFLLGAVSAFAVSSF